VEDDLVDEEGAEVEVAWPSTARVPSVHQAREPQSALDGPTAILSHVGGRDLVDSDQIVERSSAAPQSPTGPARTKNSDFADARNLVVEPAPMMRRGRLEPPAEAVGFRDGLEGGCRDGPPIEPVKDGVAAGTRRLLSPRCHRSVSRLQHSAADAAGLQSFYRTSAIAKVAPPRGGDLRA
jgi:hypothetical protein